MKSVENPCQILGIPAKNNLPGPSQIHGCMNSMENPGQINGNPPEIHEIQRKTIPDPWKSMRCLSAPNFGRRQNSIRKKKSHPRSMKSVENPVQIHGNPVEIHEFHGKTTKTMNSMKNPSQIHEICRESSPDPWKSSRNP